MERDQPFDIECHVGDHVLVSQIPMSGFELPPSEAIIVECLNQWVRVQYVGSGALELVFRTRVLRSVDQRS